MLALTLACFYSGVNLLLLYLCAYVLDCLLACLFDVKNNINNINNLNTTLRLESPLPGVAAPRIRIAPESATCEASLQLTAATWHPYCATPGRHPGHDGSDLRSWRSRACPGDLLSQALLLQELQLTRQPITGTIAPVVGLSKKTTITTMATKTTTTTTTT